jgi:hypothetical protein
VDSRKGLAVLLDVEAGKVGRVRWCPTMINKRSQPRLLRASEPEFGEVLAYMRKITEAQKIPTEYQVDGDAIISVSAKEAAAAPAQGGAAHSKAGGHANAPRSPVPA